MPESELLIEMQRLRLLLEFASQREDLLSRIDADTRSLVKADEITLTAATLLGRHMHANRCAFADVEADEDTFNLSGNYTDGTHSIVGRYTFSQFGAPCLAAMRAGEAFVVEDSEIDPRVAEVLPLFRSTEIRSVICVPLIKNGVFSTAMAVHCNTPRLWLPQEVNLVFSVASRCWESTERSRVLRDLQTSQDRLRLSQEAGKAGTFDWYIPEGKTIWTPELERLYGIPAGSFEGSLQDWSRRVHPEDAERIFAEIQTVLQQRQQEYGYDFRAILPDGSERWLHGQARFIYTSNGSPLRMIGINVDIHERRLAQDLLIRTEKLAAVGRLAASIAHEINNPLEAVTNLLYLANHSTDIEEIHRYIQQADQEVQRTSHITSQTLRFHRQSTRPSEVTAQDLFASVLGIYRGRLNNSGIRVRQKIATSQSIRCFEGEIRQVLTNLIGNAIDAMFSGGELCLRARQTVKGPGQRAGLVFLIGDTGSGISSENLKKLFEPFFTTKGVNGTGLGLWVSHEIVTRHGGLLRVRSNQHSERHGTVFSLFLPLHPASR